MSERNWTVVHHTSPGHPRSASEDKEHFSRAFVHSRCKSIHITNRQLYLPHSTVYDTVHKHLYVYKLQLQSNIKTANCGCRKRLCEEILEKIDFDEIFLNSVRFSDQSTFHLAHTAYLTNPISQPSLDISPIWISLSAMRLPTDREDQYDVADSSWVSIGFQSWVFRFYSTYGASNRQKLVSQLLHLILCTGFHDLGLLHKMFTSLSVLLSGLCMLYHKFYYIFSCYISLMKPGLRYLYSCSYINMYCPVIEVSSF
jgi:hypothetical protein